MLETVETETLHVTSVDAALSLGQPPERLRALRAEHDKLLGQIAKRRKTLEKLELELRATMTRVAGEMGPLSEEATRLDRAIHSMMESLTTEASRPRRERDRIGGVYRNLQQMGVISPGRSAAHTERDVPFGADNETQRFAKSTSTAGKETGTGALRDLFRRLAEAIHPDKVQDEQERAARTEVMKEVTLAYRERNFARLIEIERTWITSDSPENRDSDDEVERRYVALVRTNAELRKQLREIDRELRTLRNSPPALLLRDLQRHERARSGGRPDDFCDPVQQLKDSVASLHGVHDFIQGFQDGKIGLAEFLDGPDLGAGQDEDEDEDDDEDDDEDEASFQAMLGELARVMYQQQAVQEERGRGRGKRNKREGKKAKAKPRRR